jgi:tight adherence protein C
VVEIDRPIVGCSVLLGIGTTLLFAEVRWFTRASLTERLSPFSASVSNSNRLNASTTLRDLLTSFMATAGSRVTHLMGVHDDLSLRLQRASWPIDTATFRLRQFLWTFCGLLVALLLVTATHAPTPLTAMALIGFPLLAFLLLEQQVISAAQRNQRRLFNELPVVEEQLAMLLGAGYSLNSALTRIAERHNGIGAKGMQLACARIRYGLSTEAALREWGDIMDVPEFHRLVSILALADKTNDLGRLISNEAQTVRNEVHRQLAEIAEKRAQQVWIPVTVATLVPGVIFLIIPFLQALRLFAGN